MNRDVIRRWKRDKHPTARPLSNQAIALGAVIVLGIGAAAFTVLLWRYGGTGPRVDLDAIRTAGAITVAAGGAVALLLAARRQRSTEEALEHQRQTLEHQRQTLEHQREVAQATERDAAEQRITELYTRAVDQLGAKKAPVRLGGLHALERLAQNNPVQRQTLVDVICAYLRMPYTPADQVPDEDAPEDAHSRYEQRRQELQVRLTAQRVLTAHLQPEAAAAFWADIDLDLTEAHLHQLDLRACRIRSARFAGATFTEYAGFAGATFTGDARFDEAEFAEDAGFNRAKFARDAVFYRAKFAGDARFGEAKFAGDAWFGEAEFAGDAWFGEAEFAGDAWFGEAEFAGGAWFGEAEFAGGAWFGGAEFAAEDAGFGGAARVAPSSRRVILPMGWITRAAQPSEGEEEGWLYVVRQENSSEQPTEAPGDGPA